MVLVGRPPLKQQAPLLVDQEDRNGTVQSAVAMRVELRRNAHGAIELVNENDLVVVGATRCHSAARSAGARATDQSAPAASATLRAVVVTARALMLS